MSKKELKKRFGAEDVLKLLETDAECTVCINDSSSEDEDLWHPDNSVDSDDSEYCLPSSDPENYDDEDYEPEPTQPTNGDRWFADLLRLSRQSGQAAPSPTFRQMNGRFASPASKRPRPSRLSIDHCAPIECEEEVSWHDGEEGSWHEKEEEDICPEPLRFAPARTPGPTFDTTTSWSPISLFKLFFSDSVIKTIIDNTNANAARRKQAGLQFKWEVLTVQDFYIFLAIVLFTGLVSVHHRSDYWRKKWPYNFPFPREKMSRDRFEAILWSLHLSNPSEDEENDKKKGSAEYDRLFKIKPLYTEMVNACKAHFQPYKNLSIDERMVASKARIGMKQYKKDKPTKWGYLLYVLADSSTGYTCNFFVYTGKTELSTDHGFSYSTVMDLLCFPLLGSGYTLYTDNFYTSPILFTDLLSKNIGCCGTLRSNRIGFPKTQKNDMPKRAQRGEMRWTRRGKLLFVKWMDTREVNMCSTVHQAYSGQTVSRKVKEQGEWIVKSVPVPDCVVDYNKSMGGVDLSDALIGFYSVHHKTMKWYKTFFYHFVDIAVVNSFLLHKELFKFRQDPNQKKPLTHKTFREALAKDLLDLAEGSAATPTPPPATTCMPVFFESEDGRARKHCKRCLDAGTPRVKTAVYCRACKVPLCLSSKKNCFQLWHDAQ